MGAQKSGLQRKGRGWVVGAAFGGIIIGYCSQTDHLPRTGYTAAHTVSLSGRHKASNSVCVGKCLARELK